MNATSWFISIAALAWLGQILLGGWQVYQFNCAYDALHGQGHLVGLGRSGGRFTPRVVMALAFDADGYVRNGFTLRGLSVFARPRPLTRLIGLHKGQLVPSVIFPKDPACQTALALALKSKL